MLNTMFRHGTPPGGLFAAFLLACLSQMDYVHLVSHRSELCESGDVPCRRESSDECRMKYYKLNSTDCRDLPFAGGHGKGGDSLGHVRIEPYHYNLASYRQTGFNLTFTNITWTHMKFRFKQEGNDMKNTCREFHMSSNSTINHLFYDCLWSNENYEGKAFNFEYEATSPNSVSYKKYSFQVPYARNIHESTDLSHWEIFIIVEIIKNAFGMTTFVLHWQPLPERFSINSYYLKVYSNESEQDDLVYYTNITCNDFDECKYYFNKWYGSVQFGIEPICANNSVCYLSKTPVFLLGGENTKPLLIGIVSVTVIVPAMIYVIYLLRSYLIRKSKKWICPVPKVLIVFTPSLSSHVNVIFALVEYLKMYCNVEPLVDELHIFHSKSRDPFKWCNESFKSADFVMVVTSPYHKHLRLADSVYQNTDVLLLRLLREQLASKDEKTRYFLLMLPYCSESDIPGEAVNLRRFAFPEDLNKMLRFIHEDSSLPDCLKPEPRGGKDAYKLLGSKLSNAIAEAQVSLQKNKSEYDRMVEELKTERENSEQGLLVLDVDEKPKGVCKPRGKSKVLELAEGMFAEFPGRIDDLNLSGEEEEEKSLMGSQKASYESDTVNLDVLEL